MKMLKSVSFVALSMLATVLVAPSPANAATYISTPATVNAISVVKSPKDTWGENGYFLLTGVSSLGTCGTANGLVLFKFSDADKNILSTVTAAMLSGKKITAAVDDSVKDGTYCYVQWTVLQ